MTSQAELAGAAAAVLFAAMYFPALAKLSIALVSPYAKADVRRRLFAAVVDAVPPVAGGLVYGESGSFLLLVVAAAYVLLRDSMRGQSMGKLLFGLVVISIDTGQACGVKGSIQRNVVFLIPGANLAAIFLESITSIRDPQGQRLGDRIAGTQVVEGLGARDLAAAIQKSWRSVLGDLHAAGHETDREPADVRHS